MKQFFSAGLLAAALCLAAGPARADGLTMDKFAYTNALMVSGYTGTETLENFPVLVRLDNIDGFQYSNMSDPSYGRDLAFFDADGNHLASEIDTWRDSNSKKSLVWVKLPEMAQGTKFFVCYNPSASGVMVTNANPWTDYVGVWHLRESGNTGTAISDSTTNHLDGTAAADNGEGVNGSNGAIGRARRIAKNNYHSAGIIIDATNGVKNAVADSLGTDFHASFWMRAQGKVEYSYLIGRRRGDNGASWGVQFYSGSAPSKVRIFSGGVQGQNSDNECVLTDDGVGTRLSEQTSSPRTWKKVDVIWKDETNGGTPAYDFYINGEFVESKSLKMAISNEHANIGIGCSTQDVYGNADKPSDVNKKGRRLNGDMDEVRLRPGIVSADWIKADYDTVNDAQFLIGPKTVTWDVGTNGGTMDVGGATVTTSTNTVPLDFVPTAPGTPVKAGAVFVGWSTIPTATTVVDPAGFDASAPLTFYAIFADAVVRWFAADGTTPLDPAVTAVAAGSSPSHADPPAPPSTLHDRYVFEGWTRVGGDGSTVYPTAELPTVSAGDDVSYKAVFRVEHSDDPDPSLLGFSHFAALKVAGYTGSAPVENFPVLVRLSETSVSGFLYSDLASPSDGADLAFFDDGGNPVAFEIDEWNPGGESLVWVRLPSMQNGIRFTVWWGSSEVTGKSVCTADPWSEYTGVWHMGEPGSGTSVVVRDATANGLDGRPAHSSSAAVADGPVGGARFVTSEQNNSNAYNSGVLVDLSSDAAKRAAVDAIVPEFSASMWIRPKNASIQQSQFEYLISRRAADKGPGWGAQFDEKSNRFSPLRVYSNEETDKDDDGRGNPANAKVSTGASTGLAYQEWHKVDLAWTADGKYRIYVDGVQTSKDSTSTLVGGPVTNCLAATLPLCLGGSAAPLASGDSSGRGLYGDMDEVRLRPGALSADRALADFETVTNRNFLVNDTLTIAWSDASGTIGFEHIGARSAVVGGAVSIFGLADSCDVEAKIWAAGDAEPAAWTVLTNGIDSFAAFSVPVEGLSVDTAYLYALRSVGNDGETSKTVAGSFTTQPALAVAWSSETAARGLSRIAPDFVTASGTVTTLGDATACDIQIKVWPAGGAEPESWTTVAEGLALDASFVATVRTTSAGDAIAPGTAYAYALRAVGSDGSATAVVAGTFTTGGEGGEEIGSDYTEFFDDGTNACWVAKGFERYLPFTVTGYEGTEILTNFPVLVDVRASDEAQNGFTYRDFYRADGGDMAFVDETGHIIPHEIDTWNKNGMSLIWVRIPRMKNGTTFTMCYRSPLIDPLPDAGNTFERYVGVWHMNEPGNGVVSLADSTTNNLTAETHAQSLAGINVGQMIGGNARRVAQMPGSSSSYGRIIAFDHDDILRTGVGNVFTFSGWYKLEATPPKWGYLVARKSEDISKGWGIQCDEKETTKLRVWSGSTVKNTFQLFNTPGASATGWNYWTFVYDGSVNPDGTTNRLFHAYLNGNELASTEGGFTLNYDVVNDERADYDHLVIGGQENGTGAFNGFVDEARYSKGARSPDWIKAEYLSTRQKDDPFVSKGENVSKGVESRVPVIVWEKGEGLPETIVDVSYAYVQFAGSVTFCGANATECRIEYQLWADGEEAPSESEWTTLLDHAEADTPFSIPVTGLKQDMPYNFRIRAVNGEPGHELATREIVGSFRTTGNVSAETEGELIRVGNRFCHRFSSGSWTFTTPDYVTNVEILVVGGGGAGGYKVGGGGAGGGLFYSASYPVATSTTYRVQVGLGGIAASNLTARSGNGQYSYFARVDGPAEEDEVRLILVPGGGGGGSYVNSEALAAGAEGASGGGGTYAFFGGTATDDGAYGHDGGRGNDQLQNGSVGKVAAGGGGGAGREGNGGTFDAWSAGGAGGVGVANSMTGETLFYGAGGGGGYVYRYNAAEGNFTKPGGGGSGIGGNAADVRNGTPATSGVENTGAGGGGGSSRAKSDGKTVDETDSTYWQGGDGGDGVVLISYEVHGRDPISEDPCATMIRCVYDPDAGSTGTGRATIDYRVFWAGIQAETNDIYVLYSTVGEEDIAAGNGEKIRIATGAIGIGTTTFVPPEVGHTYWIRLMARKDASSFMYSDEIASFTVPAVTLNGASWVGDTTAVDVSYKLHDKAPDSHLFCYWAESCALLEGDGQPTGDGVHFLDLGTGMSGATTFTIPATEGLDRANVYYIRLACGDDGGRRHPLSDEIVELTDAPSVVLSAASWANQVATVEFTAKTTFLAPDDAELFALYSTVENDVKQWNAVDRATVSSLSLGTFETLPEGVIATNSFPLWSDVATNYYVRLGIHSASSNAWWYSSAWKSVYVTATIPNTLYIFANARAKKGAYGDAPQTLDYEVTYGGLTTGPGWENKPSVVGALGCEVSSATAPGVYDITNETLALSNGGTPWHVDAVYDDETGALVSEAVDYQYVLAYVGSPYTVTNAQFSVTISDTRTTYTGNPFDNSLLNITTSGVRNNQPVTFRYRVDSGEWQDTIDTTFSEVWTHIVQFKASATNHDDATGTFLITIDPAPLKATIFVANTNYTGSAQVPIVTTNVTGLVRGDLNPLTCEFRDEAGEWQAEVPSFTPPGTYTLWFRASAPNHATAVTNCTFTISGWDFRVNMDGQSGYPTTIRVTDPAWFIRNSPYTGEQLSNDAFRYEKLDERCANGLKLWQNYVLEREIDDALVAAIHQACPRVAENHFEIRFPNVSVLRNTGLDVFFRLDRKLAGEAAFSLGEHSDKYEMNVPLGPSDPTGLYVFNIVLSTTNDSPAFAVLPSCATVGVLRVTSPATNVVAAVPWMSMASTKPENEPVEVAETVNPNGLSVGDRILAYNTASNFQGWAHLSRLGTDWGAIEAGSTDGVAVVATNTTRFARGGAFWLVRTDPGDCFYLLGRYTGDEYTTELAGGTAAAPAYTLVANPTMAGVNLNALVFVDGSGDPATPAAGDRIVVQDAAGFQKFYVRNAANTEWGRYVSGMSDGRVTQSWESGAAVAVPSGTGFWYVRTDPGPLAIRFGGAQ